MQPGELVTSTEEAGYTVKLVTVEVEVGAQGVPNTTAYSVRANKQSHRLHGGGGGGRKGGREEGEREGKGKEGGGKGKEVGRRVPLPSSPPPLQACPC